MSAIVSCPHCRSPQAIPAALAGQVVLCPVCRRSFLAPVAAPPPTGVPLANPVARPIPYPNAPPLHVSPPHGAATHSPDEHANEASSDSESVSPRRRGWWLEFLFLFTLVGFVVAAVLLVVLVRQRSMPADSGEEPGETVVEAVMIPFGEEPRWVDAREVTLRHRNVKVKVRQAHWGPVRTRDSERRVVVDESREYLTIVVGLRNVADAPRPYRSWYGSLFRVDGRQRSAELRDGDGRVFPLHRFRNASAVQGHVPEATLERPVEQLDAIVFDIPDDVDRRSLDAIYLELPGAAFGGEGLLRFEIPTSMIEGW